MNSFSPPFAAAALEHELFAEAELRQTLDSWASLVSDREGCGAMLLNTVHGAQNLDDLPDLRRVIGSEKLTVIDPRDTQHEPLAAR
jgi:hypothetical protein